MCSDKFTLSVFGHMQLSKLFTTLVSMLSRFSQAGLFILYYEFLMLSFGQLLICSFSDGCFIFVVFTWAVVAMMQLPTQQPWHLPGQCLTLLRVRASILICSTSAVDSPDKSRPN